MAVVSEKRLHAAFEIGVVLKGLDALAELISGVVLYFTSLETLVAVVTALVHDELLGDPQDWVANTLLNAAEQFSIGGKRFAAFYLISHGVVKLILVAGLLRNRMWAYPASFAVLGAFIAYQLYRLTFAWSLALVGLTVFDLIVVWLIWHEYQVRRAAVASS